MTDNKNLITFSVVAYLDASHDAENPAAVCELGATIRAEQGTITLAMMLDSSQELLRQAYRDLNIGTPDTSFHDNQHVELMLTSAESEEEVEAAVPELAQIITNLLQRHDFKVHTVTNHFTDIFKHDNLDIALPIQTANPNRLLN